MVSDLIDLSRIEYGELKLEFEKVNINQSILKALDAIKGLAAKKEISLNFDENKDNQFLSNATRWVETKQIANENTALGKVLKAKIPDNCRKAVGGGVVISRTKAGYLTIKEETKGGM